MLEEYPHPGCFAKRARKLLKTKEEVLQKERQERSRVRKKSSIKGVTVIWRAGTGYPAR
jgi:hypothetical protein